MWILTICKIVLIINPNSLDNKGRCWILKVLYCSVTMLRELVLSHMFFENSSEKKQISLAWNISLIGIMDQMSHMSQDQGESMVITFC